MLGAVRNWLGSRAARVFLGNAAIYSASNIIASLAGLISLSIAAKTLGATGFGQLSIIVSFGLLIDRLFNFQSWQGVVKFGIPLWEAHQFARFRRVITTALLADCVGSVLAATSGIALVWLASKLIGLSPDAAWAASVYLVGLFSNIIGAPTGVLRILGRFDLLAAHQVAAGIVKVAATALAAWSETGLLGFALAQMIATVVSNVGLLALGYAVYRRSRIAAPASLDDEMRPEGFWRFLLTTNVNQAVKLAAKESDVLVAGAILGAEAAGGIRLVRQLASVLGRIADPIFVAAFPMMTRYAQEGEHRQILSAVGTGALVMGAGGLILMALLYVFGDAVLTLVAGSAFADYVPLLLLYVLGTTFANMGIGLNPALLAMGFMRTYLLSTLIATLVYLPAMGLAVHAVGAIGAAWSWVLLNGLWFLLAMAAVVVGIRKSGPSRVAA